MVYLAPLIKKSNTLPYNFIFRRMPELTKWAFFYFLKGSWVKMDNKPK